MKKMRIKADDFLGGYDLNVDIKKSEPACTKCLPPKALKDHKSLNGVLIHERIDCPANVVYMVSAKAEEGE